MREDGAKALSIQSSLEPRAPILLSHSCQDDPTGFFKP